MSNTPIYDQLTRDLGYAPLTPLTRLQAVINSMADMLGWLCLSGVSEPPKPTTPVALFGPLPATRLEPAVIYDSLVWLRDLGMTYQVIDFLDKMTRLRLADWQRSVIAAADDLTITARRWLP